MLGSRLLNMVLRGLQLVFAALVLGVMAWFETKLHKLKSSTDPHPRVIYTLTVAVVSFIAALIFFIPFTMSIVNYVWDFVMMAAWFAAFGVLVDWFGNPDCHHDDKWCKRWKAAEAFSLISAILWLLSMLLALVVVHRIRQGVVFTDHRTRSRV